MIIEIARGTHDEQGRKGMNGETAGGTQDEVSRKKASRGTAVQQATEGQEDQQLNAVTQLTLCVPQSQEKANHCFMQRYDPPP